MNSFNLNQTILSDGTYILNEVIIYFSDRYLKTVTCPKGLSSDGATGAFDITSRSWWIHDQLCYTGLWDDGTPVTNWQASHVIADVLKSEGRWLRSKYWFWATYLFGGGKCR